MQVGCSARVRQRAGRGVGTRPPHLPTRGIAPAPPPPAADTVSGPGPGGRQGPPGEHEGPVQGCSSWLRRICRTGGCPPFVTGRRWRGGKKSRRRHRWCARRGLMRCRFLLLPCCKSAPARVTRATRVTRAHGQFLSCHDIVSTVEDASVCAQAHTACYGAQGKKHAGPSCRRPTHPLKTQPTTGRPHQAACAAGGASRASAAGLPHTQGRGVEKGREGAPELGMFGSLVLSMTVVPHVTFQLGMCVFGKQKGKKGRHCERCICVCPTLPTPCPLPLVAPPPLRTYVRHDTTRPPCSTTLLTCSSSASARWCSCGWRRRCTACTPFRTTPRARTRRAPSWATDERAKGASGAEAAEFVNGVDGGRGAKEVGRVG